MSLNDRMGAWPFGLVEFPLLAKIAYPCRKQRPRNGTCDHPLSIQTMFRPSCALEAFADLYSESCSSSQQAGLLVTLQGLTGYLKV
jgi:hypothetical protein